MSPTVDDLGKRVKAKYPGQYDDLDDGEVGRRVKAKYPGAYDDFRDIQQAIPGMEKLGGAAPPPARVPIAQPPLGVSPLPETDKLTAHPTQPANTTLSRVRNWMRGDAPPVPGTKTLDIPLVSDIARGPREIAGGLGQIGGDITPKEQEAGMTRGRAIAGGTSRALVGGMQTASALLPEAALAAPVRTAAGIVAGGLAKKGVTGGLKAMDVPEEYAELGGDLAGLGTGAAAAKYAPNVVAGAATVADRLGIPEALERSAGKSYRRMLTPTAKDVVPQAEAIAGGPSENGPTGLVKNRPVALTRKGMMEKAQKGMDEVGPLTSTVYDGKPPLDPAPILRHLEALRREKAVVKGAKGDVVSDPTLNNAIDELKANLEDMRGEDGKIPAKALDDFKDKLNRGFVSPKGHMRALPPQTSAAIEKSLAGRIGAYLDKAYPDAAEINAAYRTAAQTKNFLEQQRRAEITAESGVRTGSSSGFGAALKKVIPAPLRGVPNAVAALTDSVAWDSVSGFTKAKIAELIRNGSLDQAAKLMRPLPKLLTQGDIITPKPGDISGVRGVPLAPHEQVNQMRKALPPGSPLFTQGTSVPDVTGRPDLRPGYNGGLLPAPEAGQPPINILPRGPMSVQGQPYIPSSAGNPIPLTETADELADFDIRKPIPKEVNWKVPKFAKGGIITKPTLGIVGEAGPERIMPVETLRRSVRGRRVLESLPSPDAVERTSAHETIPEDRETLRTQLAQLAEGKRRVVMFPRKTQLMKRPEGMKSYTDEDGNTYIFNPSLTSQAKIDAAIEGNTLPDLLGATHGGMGVPDKSDLREAVNVVPKAKDGTAVQSAASDRKHLKRAIKQAKKVTPKGGKVAVEDPAKEIQRRLK